MEIIMKEYYKRLKGLPLFSFIEVMIVILYFKIKEGKSK